MKMADKKCHILSLPVDVLKIIISFAGAENVGSLFASCRKLSILSRSYLPPLTPQNFEKVIKNDREDLVDIFVGNLVSYDEALDKYMTGGNDIFDLRGYPCNLNEIMLIESCKFGSIRIARKILKRKININVCFYAPLRYASYSKNIELFELILNRVETETDCDTESVLECDFDTCEDDYIPPCARSYRNDAFCGIYDGYRHFGDEECENCREARNRYASALHAYLDFADCDYPWRSPEFFSEDPYLDMAPFKKPLPGIRRCVMPVFSVIRPS